MRGIFAVDGGNATGLAWGIFEERSATLAEAVESAQYTGSTTLNRKVRRAGKTVIDGDHLSDEEQVKVIYVNWMAFKQICFRNKVFTTEMVIEDFILLPGAHAGGKDGVASARIGWGIRGYLLGRKDHSEVIWQPPSAMGKYKDDKLRELGVWRPGREHENACWKHVLARVNGILTG